MKKVLMVCMITFLMFALVGCIVINQAPQDGGAAADETETAEPQTGTEPEPEEKTEAPAEFNIAEGLKMTEDGPEKTIDTKWFTLKLGAGETWIYEINEDHSISLYNIISRDSGMGGWLGTITWYDEGDDSFKDLPSFADAGTAGGKRIIVVYPTDVQYDPENAQASEEYRVVLQQFEKIREGGGESPLQIKQA